MASVDKKFRTPIYFPQVVEGRYQGMIMLNFTDERSKEVGLVRAFRRMTFMWRDTQALGCKRFGSFGHKRLSVACCPVELIWNSKRGKGKLFEGMQVIGRAGGRVYGS